MTIRKRIVFAAIAVLLAFAVPLSMLLAADLYFHRRVERFAGVNIWGYRGPRVGRKQAGEHRLVVIGGSTAFGYGVNWDEAFPARLESDLRPLSKQGRPVSVVNLGFNTQGAYAFRFALEDFESLDYDAAILYEGYNDLSTEPNQYIGRRNSPVFRLTGYYPIVYDALREKAMSIRSGGNLDAAYAGKTVFRPGLASRATAGTLDAAATVSKALDAQLDRLVDVPRVADTFQQLHFVDRGCTGKIAYYCSCVYDAIRYALDRSKKVLVVTQPYHGDWHREQQRQMRAMLKTYFGSNRNVAYADLGDAVDLNRPEFAYDGMHLTRDGNAIIARRLAPPVAKLMPDAFDSPEDPAGRRASQ